MRNECLARKPGVKKKKKPYESKHGGVECYYCVHAVRRRHHNGVRSLSRHRPFERRRRRPAAHSISDRFSSLAQQRVVCTSGIPFGEIDLFTRHTTRVQFAISADFVRRKHIPAALLLLCTRVSTNGRSKYIILSLFVQHVSSLSKNDRTTAATRYVYRYLMATLALCAITKLVLKVDRAPVNYYLPVWCRRL